VAAGVGAGVAAGVGTGVAAGVGSGVAGGVGTGVGTGVAPGVSASVKLKTVEARGASTTLIVAALASDVETIASAATVCGPTAPAGTRIVALNMPRPLVVVEGNLVVDPSQVSWT
jgi:hypothetical protein